MTTRDWSQTREVLIAMGIDPSLLPLEWRSGIDLRAENLEDKSFQNLFLRGIKFGSLKGAHFSNCDM